MRPETLLKCARKAYPQHDWQPPEKGRTLPFYRDEEGKAVVFTLWNDCMFDLQIALEKEGWEFKFRHEHFYGELNIKAAEYCLLKMPTKPELLAACVEAGDAS